LIGLVNGALSTTDPPQEDVIVSVPVVGGQATFTTPDKLYNPLLQAAVTAVIELQLGAVYVAGTIAGAPAAVKVADTVQFCPLPHKFGKL
jgi:hypothetical protein